MRSLSGRLLFIRVSLCLLFGLSLFGAWIGVMALAFAGPDLRVDTTHLLVLAHWALPLLSGGAFLGLLLRRRWAWWIGLATFGLLGAMAAFIAFQMVLPIRVLGGEVDADWWPAILLYSIAAAPGALMWRPGTAYRDELR